ncbi:MAG: outer membrane lipoprotein-sorting protein [Nitrospinae bacterium]|nr:outer membrane lipoprotein-sorting protein [Nitrospinota bacterium]MBI3815343.1 outer membrane lipoprotein-sorting protein [Nitrospinota bacterium]
MDKAAPFEDMDARAILEKADRTRSPWSDFEMKAILQFEQRERMVEEDYRVYLKDGTKTLVAFLSPIKQRGNLLLMVGEDLWFYVKDTQRPVRITPLQRLSGGASYGDIARLNWSLDYIPTFIGKESADVGNTSYPCIKLELSADSKGATYHRILLWIEEGQYYPRKADIYLQSGKLIKTLYFTRFEITKGSPMNREIKFIDHLDNDKTTIMRFEDIETHPIPSNYFLKTRLPDLSREVIR